MDKEYAFPHDMTHLQPPVSAGMTLRDYFAAKAMHGWLANPTATPVEAGIEDASPQDLADVAAAFAYIVADAMLKARGQV